MSGVLILEDDLTRISAFKKGLIGASPLHVVHSARTCINVLQEGQWDFVFLDHDLGEMSKVGDGTLVCAWIGEHAEKFKKTRFFVHSLNPPGGERMANILFRAGLHVHRKAFAWQDETLLNYVITEMKKTTHGSV